MKKRKPAVLIVTTIAILSGCASQVKQEADRDAVFPEIDVKQINAGISEALQREKENIVRLDTLEANAADLDERILFLSEELAGTSPARIEELDTRLSLLTEAIKELQAQVTSLKEQVAAVRAQETAAPPPVKPGKLGVAAPPGKPGTPAAAASETAPPQAPATALLVSPEYAAYQAALRLCNARNYKLAIAAFSDMAQRYPGGRYADDANYWTGECSFLLADYPAAIAAFEKVIAVHGAPKADDALFRTGQAYVKTEKKENAKTAFTRLVDEFPGSEYVPRAEKYLKQLK